MNFFPQDARRRAEITFDRIRERRRKEAAARAAASANDFSTDYPIKEARHKRGTENE